ncbi:MAG: response regulator [Chloroflexota bacterium]
MDADVSKIFNTSFAIFLHNFCNFTDYNSSMMKQRILVVDDDHEVVRLMRAYLERSGYEVLVAYDGETAVYTLRHEKPDLVLLDLMLPGKDGMEITRIVRSDPSLAHIPIIMLTARVEDTDKIVGLEMGADDYVTKPYNPREVVARVRARLRSHSNDLAMQPQVLGVGQLKMDVGLCTQEKYLNEMDVCDLMEKKVPWLYGLLGTLLQKVWVVLT